MTESETVPMVLYENPQDSGQDIYGNVGYTYEQELSNGFDLGLADAQGRRAFGDNGLNICPTLVSNPVEGLLSVTGYNEVGGDFGIYGGALPDGLFYTFGAGGDLRQMDPGVPYGRYYYTRGADIYNIQDNKILRAGFERKNVCIFVKYDINDDHRLYFDLYNNDSSLKMMDLHPQRPLF